MQWQAECPAASLEPLEPFLMASMQWPMELQEVKNIFLQRFKTRNGPPGIKAVGDGVSGGIKAVGKGKSRLYE